MSSPAIPDPNASAVAGIRQQAADFPFSYIVNALAQMGGSGTVINPATGKPETLDFTGQGTADVQSQTQSQLAQVLLDIQNNYGSGYVAQRLADLKQADPNGYAAYGQLFDKIMSEASQTPSNDALSESTQNAVQNILKQGQSLTPEELTQIQNGVRGGQVGSGIYLGNAPEQAEASAVVHGLDTKQNAAQQEAGKYLSEGITPADIQYQSIQQDLANLGAFVNGQTPTAQFSQIGGAQNGAAPYSNTGYTSPTINMGQAAASGVGNANSLYGINSQQVNPYLAGLNFASQGLQVAGNAGLFGSGSTPSPYTNYFNNYMATAPSYPSFDFTGYTLPSTELPAVEPTTSYSNFA